MDTTPLNVAEVIDRRPVGALQIRLFVLCALCLLMAGFIVQSIGFVAPFIIDEFGIENAAMRWVFAFGNGGILVGALLFTMLADTIGRRPVLAGATLFFGVVTLATAWVGSVEQLVVYRFVAGLALGCVIPNATALIGEYSPRRLRVTLMMTVTVSFTAGAAFGGFVAMAVIEAFELSWRAVFVAGGLIPIAVAVGMQAWLPESLQFLVLRGRHLDRVRGWLRGIDPALRPEGRTLVVSEEDRRGVPMIHLFREGRGVPTVLLWTINFMNILIVYSLANWIPVVVRDAGYTGGEGVFAGTMLQVGGTIGTFVFAWLIARRGFMPVLAASFAVGCLAIASVAPLLWSVALLTAAVFVAGWCSIGAQPGLNALAATYYPTYMRSTGVGWCLGIGRIGAIVGPLLAGELMARQWTGAELLYAATIPALLAALGMLALRVVISPQQVQGASSAAVPPQGRVPPVQA